MSTSQVAVVGERGRFGREDYLKEAVAIGDRLVDQAFFHQDGCNWLVRRIAYPGQPPPPAPTLEPLNCSVHSGSAGVALFLGHLWKETEDTRYRRVALGAIRRSLRNLHDLAAVAGSTQGARMWRNGYYLGELGVALAAHELSDLLGEPDLAEPARGVLERLWRQRKLPKHQDVMFGNAGAIPPLLALHERTGDSLASRFAEFLGEDLLATAEREGDAWSWGESANGIQGAEANLTGFAHGAAGIGWGLSHLAAATGRDDFREAALGAFAYERLHYDREHKNWRLYQPGAHGDARRFGFWWCHGAPGIGVSRRAPSRLLREPELRKDMRSALPATRKSLADFLAFPGRDATCCHGFIGVAECLRIVLGGLEGEARAADAAAEVGDYGLARYGHLQDEPWPSGVAKGEHPGLNLGIAGIGHFYLRLYAGERVRTMLLPPSVEK